MLLICLDGWLWHLGLFGSGELGILGCVRFPVRVCVLFGVFVVCVVRVCVLGFCGFARMAHPRAACKHRILRNVSIRGPGART